jgi:hypothetical protein
VIFLALAVVGVVVNTLIATSIAAQPLDYSLFAKPGAALLLGRWSEVYADSIVQAGPLELAFWGVPALLGVGSTAAWTTVGVISGLLLSLALFVVSRWVLRQVAPADSTLLAAGITGFAALGLVTTRAFSDGHPAEFAIPVLWIIAAQLARAGRPAAAAAVLAATSGWELWGLLGVPVLLLAPRIRGGIIWRSALAGTAVIAVLYLPFFLVGPMRMFSFTWQISAGTLAHLVFPGVSDFGWPLRLAQGVLSVGAGAAIALWLRRRVDAVWLSLLTVCVVRLLVDPVLAGYYSIPPELLALLGAGIAIAQRSVPTLVLCVVIANVLTDTRLTVVTAGVSALTTALAVGAVALHQRRAQSDVDRSFSGSSPRG